MPKKTKSKKTAQTDIHQIVAENLRKHRLGKGWSQEQLALEAGVHRVYLGRVECCKQTISLATLEKIANALDVSVKDLF